MCTKAAIALLALNACGPASVHISFPDEIDANTTIVFLENEEGLGVSVVDHGHAPIALPETHSDARLSLLSYALTVEELQLGAGALESDGLEGRPLPEFFVSAVAGSVGGGTFSGWSPIDGPPEAARSFRLPPFDSIRCAEARGCRTSPVPEDRCRIPCMPVSPELPERPDFSCPTGWTDIGIGRAPVCRPEPPEISDCGTDEAYFLGAGCTRVGPECPPGDWPTNLSGPVVYVRPGAVAGDGTLVRPYGQIDEAISVAAPGTTIALSKGQHTEATLSKDVGVVGACADETRITATATTALTVEAHVTVRDIHVDARDVAIHVAVGASLTLSGAVVGPGDDAGITVSGSFSAADVVIRDRAGQGVWFTPGASGDVDRLTVERAQIAGVDCQSSARVSLRHLLVRSPRARFGTTDGYGIRAERGCNLEVANALIQDAQSAGILVDGVSTTATISDLIVLGTRPPSDDPTLGFGIFITNAARLRLRRALIEDNSRFGIEITDAGNLVATEVAVRDTRRGSGSGHSGISANFGGNASIERAWITGDAINALGFFQESVGFVSDLIVAESALGRSERGVDASGSHLTLYRAVIENVLDVGIRLQSDATASIEDLVLRDMATGLHFLTNELTTVRRWTADNVGDGYAIDQSSTAAQEPAILEDFIIERSSIGLWVRANSFLKASRFVISDLENAAIHIDADNVMIAPNDGMVLRNGKGARLPKSTSFEQHHLDRLLFEANDQLVTELGE